MIWKMIPEVKALWIAALRSGNYKQGRGVLRSEEDAFCCLGVLEDLAVKAGVTDAGVLISGAYEYKDRSGVSATGLTPLVRQWSGIISTEAALPELVQVNSIECRSLVGLNDEAGASFEQIADVIEEHF
jgi:hypothetical protein